MSSLSRSASISVHAQQNLWHYEYRSFRNNFYNVKYDNDQHHDDPSKERLAPIFQSFLPCLPSMLSICEKTGGIFDEHTAQSFLRKHLSNEGVSYARIFFRERCIILRPTNDKLNFFKSLRRKSHCLPLSKSLEMSECLFRNFNARKNYNAILKAVQILNLIAGNIRVAALLNPPAGLQWTRPWSLPQTGAGIYPKPYSKRLHSATWKPFCCFRLYNRPQKQEPHSPGGIRVQCYSAMPQRYNVPL